MELREQLRREGIIPLKHVMGLPLFLKRPTWRQVKRWASHGIAGIRLESVKEGGRKYTSVAAVERFYVQTNGSR